MNRAALKIELIRDECKDGKTPALLAYRDSLGYWTIGVGHLLGTTPRMSTITEDEAAALLEWDVNQAVSVAKSVVPLFDQLDDVRQRATVNMAFNRGRAHMMQSKTIVPAINHAIASGEPSDWIAVKDAIAKSEWASQVHARADRIGAQYEIGTKA